MIDPRMEIERLKSTLKIKGLDYSQAEEVGMYAQEDIDNAINELAQLAMEEAANAGMIMGATEFAEELQIVKLGGIPHIKTLSNQVDFTLPRREMLDDLLKNAKETADGTKYKIIPVGAEGGQPTEENKRFTTLMDVQQNINRQNFAAVQQRKRELKEARKMIFTGSSSMTFTGLAKAQEFLGVHGGGVTQATPRHTMNVVPDFRTATSKQNPSTQWVLPERPMNMQLILADINRQLENDIQEAVRSIVRQYEGLV